MFSTFPQCRIRTTTVTATYDPLTGRHVTLSQSAHPKGIG
jgi:hypothetical protein